jgi:predicted MFS family arabinose efflux permease
MMAERDRKDGSPSLGYAVFAGFAATFMGIGISRFAYTPLVPVVIDAGWFDEAQAAYLGAANLLGYLLGAISAHRVSLRFGAEPTMRVGLLVVAASYAVCSAPLAFAWFFAWRFAAGLTGAWLMVLAAPWVLARTPSAYRGRAGALVFTGIGGGVLLSATLVPALAAVSPSAAWLSLAVLAGAVSIAAWPALRRQPDATGRDMPDPADAATNTGGSGFVGRAVALVLSAYVLFAVGFVPHTVFWVDYLARGRDLGMAVGGTQWALFGAGSVAGPLITGWVADRIGFRRALVVTFSAMGVATGLPFVVPGLLAVSVSSVVVGAATPAVVALTSGYLGALVGAARHRRVWGSATALFSVAQACAGYGMSATFDLTRAYAPLFLFAAGALLVGGLCTWLVPSRGRMEPQRKAG